MSGFIAHVSDARDFLARLILHQRDNPEDQARSQHRRPGASWVEAVADAARPPAGPVSPDGPITPDPALPPDAPRRPKVSRGA